MDPVLVSVQFRNRYNSGFSGNPYTYIADTPMKVGDVVNVPTKYGTNEARVCRVGVPINEIECRVGELRHITEAATPGGDVFKGFFD